MGFSDIKRPQSHYMLFRQRSMLAVPSAWQGLTGLDANFLQPFVLHQSSLRSFLTIGLDTQQATGLGLGLYLGAWCSEVYQGVM